MQPVPSSLHEILLRRQSDAELARKRAKAQRRGYWTQEEIDYFRRKGERIASQLQVI